MNELETLGQAQAAHDKLVELATMLSGRRKCEPREVPARIELILADIASMERKIAEYEKKPGPADNRPPT